MSAPLTPDTISRIRNAANAYRPRSDIARELGWDSNRLERIARQHGIELCGAALASPSVLPTTTETTAHCITFDGVEWYPQSGHVWRNGKTVTLIESQASLFGVLLDALMRGEGFLLGSKIACRIVCDTDFVSRRAARLRKKLLPLGLDIETSTAKNGGYKLTIRE